MDIFLDSVHVQEIEEAFSLGVVKGLTTTPTFMHRDGIKDIDEIIVKLAGMVPELHIEALGETHDDIVAEAHRLLRLPLETPPVFKIPVSNHGIRACRELVSEGHRVNVHLVYTLNQAHMAMAAGASYVCPLAGRLQDQGHDAISLFEQCVQVARQYNYPAKIMFSSVRHTEHVRQALLAGVDVCTIPWAVMRRLCDNELTNVGSAQFVEHMRLMVTTVKSVIRPENPVCTATQSVMEALVRMTESGLGAVTIVDEDNHVMGIFTDGDVRRRLRQDGQEILSKELGELGFSANPVMIGAEATLQDAVEVFTEHKVDNIVVLDDGVPSGMLDIQDLVKLRLLG